MALAKRHLLKIILLAAALATALWLGVADLLAQRFTQNQIDHQIAVAIEREAHRVDVTQTSIQRRLNYLQTLPKYLAGDEAIITLLQHVAASGPIPPSIAERRSAWAENPDIVTISRRLKSAAEDLGVDLIFVTNADGISVATSNLDSPAVTLGHDFADRGYFQATRAGKLGRQFIVGRTTGEPGLDFAYPILVNGQVIGMIAVKANTDAPDFRPHLAAGFLTDDQDVIVAADDPGLTMRALNDARVEALSPGARLQLYRQTSFETLRFAPAGIPRHEDLVRLPGQADPSAVITRDIGAGLLTLHALVPLPQIAEARAEGVRRFRADAAYGALCIVLLAYLAAVSLRALAQRQELKRSNLLLQQTNALLSGQREILVEIAHEQSSETAIGKLVILLERLQPGTFASVFLLDEEKRHLYLSAAPSLPPFFVESFDGVEIGPETGSCGAAAFLGDTAIVSDIATDPRWETFRDVALRAGLRACWSVPIWDSVGGILGTFALYYPQPRVPQPADLDYLQAVANTASIAIQAGRTRTALRQSAAKFEQITEASAVLISVVERGTGRALFRNSTWAAQFGPVLEPDHSDLVTCFVEGTEIAARLTAHQVIDGMEVAMHNAADQPRAGLLNARPIAWDNRDAVVIAVLDIEDRKQAVAIAAEAARLNERILATMVDGLIVFDGAGKVHQFNQSAERIFGYAADEVIGLAFERLTTLSETHPIGSETIVSGRRKNGALFPMELTVSLLTAAAAAENRLFIATLRDITARQRSDAELRAAKEKAEAASRSKTSFLANMSHELRTPMNAIIGFSEIIAQELVGPINNPRYVQYAIDIHSSAQHLLDLICDILDMSKIEAGRLSLNDEQVDIADVIADAILVLSAEAQKKQVAVTQWTGPGIACIWADHKAMRQILINLVSNAVKFTPAGGRVVVSAELDLTGNLVLAVSDTGIGIPPEALDRIFLPFEQVDGTLSRQFEGTGLGLSITRGLVELHGGEIAVTSTIGEGTVLRVTLPAGRLRAGIQSSRAMTGGIV